MTRTAVAAAAPADLAQLSAYLGKNDPEVRAKSEAALGWPSLLTLGHVAASEGRPTTYTITAAGRTAYAATLAAETPAAVEPEPAKKGAAKKAPAKAAKGGKPAAEAKAPAKKAAKKAPVAK